MILRVCGSTLVAELAAEHRCVSSAVLGGGIGRVRTWLNVQVPADYARTDPERHLLEVARVFPGPHIGMLTAADVSRFTEGHRGSAHAVATVGLSQPLAAAGLRPRSLSRIGTINLFVLTATPLTDAGLIGAVATATEAKTQALARAGVDAVNATAPATGTATDALCIACPPAATEPFAGPATRVGGNIAHAVLDAVYAGILCWKDARGRRSLAGAR